ncbi:hypothetical protein [Thiohalocapsa halophila]
MPLEIRQLVWLEDIVEKLRWKHGVEEAEVVEVLERARQRRRNEAGHVPGEHVYAAGAPMTAVRSPCSLCTSRTNEPSSCPPKTWHQKS